MRAATVLLSLTFAAGAQQAKPPHWAFVPPLRPEPPAVQAAGWCRNPIDRFVLARLESEGLAPAPEADRRTLLRRAHLDLTGLLPTPEEIESFVADRAADAFERRVELLLASPHHAERMARRWLDLARYADSDGYAVDGPRSHWRWRDWVIDAIDRDMPFDRFTVEQLAGDLLPGATPAQRIATGFHRNTLRNDEGGVDPEEFRNEALKDRVNTTATVWLGLTLGCAQCHDHKYDPFKQREYYELFAFFNDADEHDLVIDQAAVEAAKRAKKHAPRDAVALVMRQTKEPRTTRIHKKGDFMRLGDEVAPATPGVLPPLAPPAGRRATRLDLARWIASEQNPLFARVAVNRLWQYAFGKGLVATENDFGRQGSAPSHAELLDWLATEFARQRWGTKAMLRLIVTSATYRQASTWRGELAERDADNVLLARQSRLRLDAEIIRDAALCASGRLAAAVGGKSVYPPQPEGVTALGQFERKWTTSTGADRYRRGMYTAFLRGTPHPALTVFDAPMSTETCTRRMVSNTPLQALTLLDDPAFHELAEALGERLARMPGTPADKVGFGAQLALSRPATPGESQALLALLGSHPGQWLLVARALLNCDAFVTRE
jgi:hypothetical protein